MRTDGTSRRRVLAAALVAAVAVAAVATLAGSVGAREPGRIRVQRLQQPGEEASPQKVFIGGGVHQVTYACQLSEDVASQTSSTSWKTVPGASQVVPLTQANSGRYRLIRVTFTGQSACFGGNGRCAIRLMIKRAAAPDIYYLFPGSEAYAFDSTPGGGGRDDAESHAVTRAAELDDTWGDVEVFVQYRSTKASSTSPAPTFLLDDWAFDITESTR